jgi:beta-glucosidase-like glycosyl hydrolase|eukprot:COSAG02_NODE_22_length_53020_cov_16.223125_8_plen_96_part_00
MCLGIARVRCVYLGPNINNPRDPRFGRLSELPSEDPVHAGMYASEFIGGMQERDAAGHPKMIALLKHFTACELSVSTRAHTLSGLLLCNTSKNGQ